MNAFLELDFADRQLACKAVQAAMGLDAASIEKDFWVCWTLRELFALPGVGGHLTFKGGTSLSKAWQLIERFHRHPIEEKNAPQGEMDGMCETCRLAGDEKTKTPASIGFKVQRFPAALQSDSLPPGVQIGEGNWR